MDVRLIALDLDGTLLDSDRNPHPRAIRAIREAHAAGIAICLASGRVAQSVRRFSLSLQVPCWVVACNGAHVLNPEDGEMFHAALAPSIRDAVIVFARSKGSHLNLYHRHRVICVVEGPLGSLYRSRVRNLVTETHLDGDMPDLEATKMMLVEEPETVARLAPEFCGRWSPQEVAITISEAEYLEFLPPGVDKSVALSCVADALGLEAGQVAAMGDFHNDLEMLRWAGFSGAPANAIKEVRAVADRVFATHDEGGAGEFVDSILEKLR